MEDGVKKGPQGHKEAAEIRGKKYNGKKKKIQWKVKRQKLDAQGQDLCD